MKRKGSVLNCAYLQALSEEIIVTGNFDVPTTEELLIWLTSPKVFSKLDLHRGFSTRQFRDSKSPAEVIFSDDFFNKTHFQ